jgi:membrane protease YdiL (CAAX protease family)
MRRAYYFFYYIIYKTWSKNYNPLVSNDFRTDICMIALNIWALGVIGVYLSILLGIKLPRLSIAQPIVFIPLFLAIGSVLYFFTFSNKWKPYFKEFEEWPKRKRIIGGIIVWMIVIFIFINVFISVEMMRKINGSV